MKEFIKNRLNESLEEIMFEALLDEEYPTNFNIEEFKKLTSFNQRIKYCQDNLQRISSGSGRIVYKIDNEKVLKLAKNKKGVAQNEAEAQWMNDYYFDGILAKVFDAHPQDLWNEMELARKVTPAIFKNYFGFDLDTVFQYLKYRYLSNNGKGRYINDVDPEIADVLHENQDVQTIYEFADTTDSVGDLGKLSTYGLVKRNGEDRIVLIDFGLNSDVYDSYYK